MFSSTSKLKVMLVDMGEFLSAWAWLTKRDSPSLSVCGEADWGAVSPRAKPSHKLSVAGGVAESKQASVKLKPV